MKVKHLLISMIAAAFLSSAIGTDNTLEIGKKAPKIEMTDGTNVGYDANSEGKTKVVNFWNPKNPASRITNKKLSQQYGQDNKADVEFISICTDSDETLMREVMKMDGTNGNKSYAYSEISPRVFKDYEVENHPRTFIISPDGKITKIL